MSCIVIHKGKHYSEEEFRKYLFKNKTEFTAALTSSKTITEMFANSLGVDLNQLQLEPNKNTEESVEDKIEALEKERQEDLRKISPEVRFKPGAGKSVKIGQQFNEGNKLIVITSTLHESYDPKIHGEGYAVYSRIRSEAEYDKDGKIIKVPEVDVTIFPDKETADRVLNEIYQKYSKVYKENPSAYNEKVNRRFDAKIAELKGEEVSEEKGTKDQSSTAIVEEGKGKESTTKQTSMSPEEIYDSLVKKDNPSHVVISNIRVNDKYNREANLKHAKENGYVYSMKMDNDIHSFSNPWASFERKGTIKTPDTKTSVLNYIKWLTTDEFKDVKPERRKWILEQIKTGKLKGKPLQYYADLGEPSHANALDYLINVWAPAPSVKVKPNVKIVDAAKGYTRDAAKIHPEALYIFTDNTDRTSGDTANVPNNGWYARKYGKGLSFGTLNNPTTAVIRGLDNAYPISTMKRFYKKAGLSIEQSRWTDADFNEFKKVIGDEINTIKEALYSGKYKYVVFPINGVTGGKISQITKERTPKLYAYLNEAIKGLKDSVNNKLDTVPPITRTPAGNIKVEDSPLKGATVATLSYGGAFESLQQLRVEYGLGQHLGLVGSSFGKLSAEVRMDAETAYNDAIEVLGMASKPLSEEAGVSARLQHYLVAKSDKVIAIGHTSKSKTVPGETVMLGGPGLAFEYAKRLNEPFYFYQRDRNEWNKWDPAKKAFRVVPAPALSLNTYMVGDINASKEAVYNVFKQVFEASIGKEGKQVKLDGLSPQAAATVEASKKQIESAQGDKSMVVNLMSPKDMVDLTEGSIIQVVMKGTAVPIGTIKDKRLHIEIPEGAENILSEHAIKHLNEAKKEEGIVLVDEESIEDLDSLLVNIGGLDATYRAISPSIDNKNPAAHLSTVETVPGKKSTVKGETKTDPAPSTPSGKMSAEEAQELLAEALDRGMTVEELKRERAEGAEWVRPKGGPDTSMMTPHNTPFGESYPGSFILPGEEKEVSEETPQENSENLENVPPLSDIELLEESLAYEEGEEATHIDDASMPGTDDNTVNPVVSEESPSLEEILDIFATPKVKTEPKEEPKPKPAFEEQSSGPVHIEGVDNVSDSDALGSFFDDVANNMPFEQTNEDPYNLINLKEELAWLYSRFGKSLNVKHIDTLIEIAHNRRAFGMFTKDAIILSKLAMEGTAYHEAYHRVSLLYLTPEQRAAIYAEARSKYDLKDASNKVIEERLAEEFRAYKLSKQANIKLSLPKRIAEFFKDLYDMITNFFTGTTRLKKLDIDRLFQAIDKGKFKYTKPNAESLAMLEDSETYFEIGGEDFVKLPNSIDAKNAISFGIRTLLEASGVISTNEAGAPVMNYSIIKDITDIKMENLWRALSEKTIALNNFVIHNGNKAGMKDSVSKALGVIDLFTEILDKKNAFGKAIVEKLRSMDIKSTTEDENFISREEVDEDERKRIVDYDKMSFEVNPKDTVAAKVKLLLSILPANDEITDGNGLPMLSDFDSTWNTLMETVSSSENLTEMMEGLATLALTGKTFSSLYNTLLSDPYAQIGVYTSAFKSKYNFINAIVEETGEGLNIQFASADVQTQAKALLQEWNTAALFNKNLVLSEGESAMNANALRGTKYIDRVNESRIQIVSKMMREDYDEDSKRLANFSSYLKAAEKLFNLMSIGVTSESLEKYVNLHLHPHEALVDLLAVSLAYITGPKSSIYRNIENGTNLNKLMSSEKIIRNLAEATVATSEMDATNSIIGPNGNLYFTIADGTYMNDVLRGLKKLEEVERMLNSTYSSGSIILQAAREKGVRDNLKITTLSSTVSRDFNKGEEYFNLGPAEDTLVRMEAIIKGKFIMPTPADRGFYSFIEGVENIHGYTDVNIEGNNMQVLSTFLKYYKNENDRVKQVRKQINDIVDGVGEMLSSEMFEFYHYKVVNDTSSLPKNAVVIGNKLLGYRNEDGVIDKYVGNGANFSDFTGAEIDMSSRDAIRFINNALLAREESTIESLRKDKIIKIKNGKIVHSFLNEDLINKLIKEDFSGMTRGEAYDAAVRSIIRHYNVNVIASAIEVNKVFNGDPAAFKDIYDETKRLLGLTSTGSRMALGLPESVHNGERLLAIDEYNVMYLNDQLSENTQYDTVYEQYTKSLLEEGLASTEEEAKEIATKRLKALEKFSRTDGQTLVSPEWYRAVSKRLDLWNDEKEEAFNRLISVNKNNANLTKDIDVVMQPLKLLYYQVKRENGNAVTVFDKTSYYPLFKSVYEGTPIEDTINRMESTGRYAGLPKVDVIKFHKSTKSGIQERVDMFEDPSELKARDLTSHPYYVQEFKHLRYQLNTKQHEDNNVPLGVQMNKLGVLNIHNDSTYKIGEDKVSGADIWRHYDRLRGSHTNQGRFRYIENIGADQSGRVVDEATLQAKLKEEAIRANMPGYISNSFGTDELGRKSVEFDAIPGTRRWVENRFFAISRRHTINMESSGNAFIQATDIGLRKSSKSGKHTKIREGLKFINEQGLTEVAISISVYKDIIPGYDKMNHKERVSYIMGHDLNLLGYRIPTQGPNSMYMLTVKTFLPHHTGGVIVLPGEGTAIGGFDFDIDKLYVIRPNFNKAGKIKYLTKNNSTVEERYIEYLKANAPKEVKSIFRNRSKEESQRIVERYKTNFGSAYRLSERIMADVKNYNKVFNDAESYLEEMFERVMPNNITASETELEFAKLQLAALKLINSSSARTKQVMIDINNMFKKGRTSNASKPSVIYKELHSVMSDSKSVSESFLKELTKLRTLYGAMNALLFTSITSEMDVRSQSEIELYKSIAEFKGMPSLEEFGNLPIEEQNTQAAVENRLIDMYRSVAMHPKHAIARITPLEFAGNELKQISNITREKGGFAAAEADLSQPFSTRDHSYQRNVKSKYSFGSKGLGPSALNNTHHVLTQLYNTGIKNSSQLMNTFDDVMLNTIIGKDNVYVQEWLSAFVDGHVDVSADEYMYFLNINETTRNALFSSIRMGDGIKGVLLITQPIIIEAAQRHEGSKKLFGKRKVNPKRLVGSMREELRESLEEVITAQILSNPKFKGATNAAVKLELENRLNELFSSEAVSSYFTDGAMMKNLEVPESKSLEYMAAEIKYLEMFSNYLHIGELLSNLVLNSRVDTGKAGNNITDAVSYLSSVVEVASSEDYINARELLIDSFLGDMLKNNIVTTINTLSDQFITASNYALNITEYVMQSYVDRQFNGDKKRSDLSNAIYSKVISTFFNNKFDNKISNIKKLLKGDNSVAYRILKLKNDPRFAEIKEYEFIKRMNPIIDSKESIDYIMFRKTNDSGINEDMQNEWRQMYNHPDPNISNLAVDLFYYSYFTTGFSPTVFSFFNIVPTSIIHDTGFNDFIREIKPTLASKEATEEDIQDIFLSNTHNTNLVPLLSESAIGQHVMGGRLPLVFSSNHFNVLTSDDTFIRYVQLKDEEGEKVVYKLSGLREGPSGVSGVYAMVPYRGISSKVYNIQGYSYSRNIPTLRANIAAEATAAIKNYDTDALIGLAFRLDNSFDGVTPLPESYSTYRSYSEISGDTSLIEASEANSDLHTALENESEEFATPKYIREGTYNINGNKITLTMIGSESSNFNYAIKYENTVPTKEENEEQQNKCK